MKGIERQIHRENLDIYHGLSNEIPMIRWPKSVKKVVTIHDVIFKHYPRTYPLFDRTIYHTKVRYATTNADLILSVSEHTKSDLVRHYGVSPERIYVLPIDTGDHFYPTVEKPTSEITNQIACISSFGARKNIIRLIEAFHMVRENVSFDLVLAGSPGDTLANCRKLVSKLRLEDRVSIQTEVTNPELVQLYDSSDALIYPSLYEGFGLPILEAYRRGIPVICSSSSSLPEVGGELAEYFDPEQVESIASALQSVDLTKKNSADFQKDRLQLLEQFSRDKLSAQLMNLYQGV